MVPASGWTKVFATSLEDPAERAELDIMNVMMTKKSNKARRWKVVASSDIVQQPNYVMAASLCTI